MVRTTGKPRQDPGGTSTAVGPSFFVGQGREVRRNRGSHELTNALGRLGWISLGAAALFSIVALEWQTWHRPPSSARTETVTIAQNAAEQNSPAPPASVRTAAPASLQARTAPVATSQPSSRVVAKTRSFATDEAANPIEPGTNSTKVKLLRAAMGRGDTDAPVSLANMYMEGRDVSRSCDQALHLLESAAAKNNARARNRLALMYEIGACVQPDRVQAYRWLSSALAADRNNAWAQQNRDQTWREMTSEERTIAEAYR